MSEEDHREWLDWRKGGVGGSDVSALMGENPFRTARDVYDSKQPGYVEQPPTPAMQRGLALEEIALNGYLNDHPHARLMGREAQYADDTLFMRGTVDATIQVSPNLPSIIAEVKCPGLWAYEKMKRDGIPSYYLLQMQHYLSLADKQDGVFIIFCADKWEWLYIPIARDEAVIERIRDACFEFWTNHIQKNVPPVMHLPPPPPAEASDKPVVLITDEATIHLAQSLVEINKTAAEIDALRDARLADLKAVLKEPGRYQLGDQMVATYTSATRKGSLNEKALASLVQSLGGTAEQVQGCRGPAKSYDSVRIFARGDRTPEGDS